MMKFNCLLSHTCLNRIQFHIHIPYRSLSILQRLQTFQTCPLLGTSCPASTLCPFQFHTKHTLPLPLTGKLHLLTLCLQLQKLRVIGLISIKTAMGNLQNLIGNPVKEISVMGNHDHNTFKTSQKILQPGHHLIVQMVGRLVQKQHITGIHQCPGQCHPLLLPSGQMINLLLVIHNSKLIQYIPGLTLCAPVLLPLPLSHIIQDRSPLRKLRHLRQIRNPETILCDYLPFIRILQTTDDLQNCRLPGSVNPDNPNLIPLMHPIGNIIQNHLFTKHLGNMLYIQNIHKLKPLS